MSRTINKRCFGKYITVAIISSILFAAGAFLSYAQPAPTQAEPTAAISAFAATSKTSAKNEITFALVTEYWGWGVEIMTKPDFMSERLALGYPGDYFRIIESYKDGWAKIGYEGKDAYMYLGGDVKVVSASELVEQNTFRSDIVNYALQFVGNPYVWGGTDPNKGADCSGFVQYVLKYAGNISISRTAKEQALDCELIHVLEMRPGDLMFYGESMGEISHVTVYIGNGQVVHASDSRSGIKISNWDYRPDWLCIGNIIGDR